MSLALRHYHVNQKFLATQFVRQKSQEIPRFSLPELIGRARTVGELPALDNAPEVIVTGRANAGKSTLFNEVLERRNLLTTSKNAGCTTRLNFYRVTAGRKPLVLVDSPGYGARGRREWGDLFNSYIETRKQLKRVYILFNAKHGLNEVDLAMLAHLSSTLQAGTQSYSVQPVITKVDSLPAADLARVMPAVQEQIRNAAPSCLAPIITSSEIKYGIDRVRENIMEACGVFQRINSS